MTVTDDSEGAARYRARVARWMQARQEAGGTLTEDEEEAHVQAVHDLRSALSEAERDAIEKTERGAVELLSRERARA